MGRALARADLAIEGANGLGHLLAQQLVTAGEVVVDVPAMLAARARQLDRGHGRKTDGIDAQTVAGVAQRRPDLRRVAPEDHAGVLRLLSDRRTSSPQSAGGWSTGFIGCFAICVRAVRRSGSRRRRRRGSLARSARRVPRTSSARRWLASS